MVLHAVPSKHRTSPGSPVVPFVQGQAPAGKAVAGWGSGGGGGEAAVQQPVHALTSLHKLCENFSTSSHVNCSRVRHGMTPPWARTHELSHELGGRGGGGVDGAGGLGRGGGEMHELDGIEMWADGHARRPPWGLQSSTQ